MKNEVVEVKWWNHELLLSGAYNFIIKWNNLDSSWLTLEMSANTEPGSFLGIGFTTVYGDENRTSDFVVGFIDNGNNGEAKLLDLHGVVGENNKNGLRVVEDVEHNYQLLSSSQSNGKTILKFRRKWNTCDDQDVIINENTIRLVWSVGKIQNLSLNNNNTQPIELEIEGSRSLLLKLNSYGGYTQFPNENETSLTFNDDEHEMSYWDFFPNNTVNGESTIYLTGIIKFPHETGKNRRIIGFKPLFDILANRRVHHLLFFACRKVPKLYNDTEETIFDEFIGQPSVDFFSQEPYLATWYKYCDRFAFVWTIGSEGMMFPTNGGAPIGEKFDESTYFLYQLHYDNPELEHFTDHSGLRFYYTDEMREHDTGLFSIAHRVSLFHVIPPKTKSFTNIAFCSNECTSKTFPKDGITVAHALLHGHWTATKIILRHIRNGTELPLLAKDEMYDPLYQEYRDVYPQRKILPGDELIVECTTDTSARENVTLGGIEGSTEMCVAFLIYYPKAPLAFCVSQPELHTFYDALDVQYEPGPLLDVIGYPYTPGGKLNIIDDVVDARKITNSISLAGGLGLINITTKASSPTRMNLQDYYSNYNWRDNAANFERKLQSNPYYTICPGAELENYITQKPFISSEYKYPKDDNECDNDNENHLISRGEIK